MCPKKGASAQARLKREVGDTLHLSYLISSGPLTFIIDRLFVSTFVSYVINLRMILVSINQLSILVGSARQTGWISLTT